MKTDLLDIRNCDCMDMMREYPDNHFELAIVDPPYGIGADKAGAHSNIRDNPKWGNKNWDSSPPSIEYFRELSRVSRHQIIWGANHFADRISNPASSGWIVWDKTIHGNTLSDGELAFCSIPKPVRIFSKNICFITLDGRIHPTQKPVALYKWLLQNYAKEGDKILDTHMGSGSIAIACHYMGFNLTACELDEDYYQSACERIERETAQTEMAFI